MCTPNMIQKRFCDESRSATAPMAQVTGKTRLGGTPKNVNVTVLCTKGCGTSLPPHHTRMSCHVCTNKEGNNVPIHVAPLRLSTMQVHFQLPRRFVTDNEQRTSISGQTTCPPPSHSKTTIHGSDDLRSYQRTTPRTGQFMCAWYIFIGKRLSFVPRWYRYRCRNQ